MASSGPKGECLAYHHPTCHRWHQSMCEGGVDTGAREIGIPYGEDHAYQCELCTPCKVKVAGNYLRWKAAVSCRTSSQMWGSCNLPRFLLRDGSLTLMNIASLMVLVMLCTFKPSMEKLSTLIQCPKVLPCFYMREKVLRHS